MYNNPDKSRNVIPRWRDSATSRNSLEVRGGSHRNKTPIEIDSDEFSRTEQRWRKDKSAATALDLLGSAIVFSMSDTEVVLEARKFLDACDTAPIGRELLGETSLSDVVFGQSRSIGSLRAYLRRFPRNPYLWSDLSLHYASGGMKNKAERAMQVAFGLAPLNRLIIRVAARHYVYRGDLQKAHWTVEKSPNLKYDPWLLSAELALSSSMDKSSRYTKYASQLLESGHFGPADTSELASALATMEIDAGKIKRAKKLLSGDRLAQPTENALAQVAFVERRAGINIETSQGPEVTHTFERDAWKARWDEDWEKSVSLCYEWFEYQPISSRPAILATYIACTALDDPGCVTSMADKALIANTDDFMLRNNLAVCHAKSGNVTRAAQLFDGIKPETLSDSDMAFYHATSGLIAYRTGDINLGRSLYSKAVSGKLLDPDIKVVSSIFQTVEELRLLGLDTTSEGLLKNYKRRISAKKMPEFEKMIDNALSGK